jgi:hypothetical protein
VRAGHGFGAWMGDNLELLGTREDDITTNAVADFAHGDHYASPDVRTLLIQPLFHWLKRVAER